MQVAVIILGLLALGNVEAKKDFTGYKVISVTPVRAEDVKFLVSLQTDYSLDFWQGPTQVGRAVEVMVQPAGAEKLMRSMREHGMEPALLMSNVQEAIDWEKDNHERIVAENKLKGVSFSLNQYHSTDEMYAWYDELAAAHSDVTVTTVGQSFLSRPMKLLEIGTGGKPVQFFDCLIHAREWIAGSVCLWIMDQLVKNQGEAATLRAAYDFKFVVPTNPDGYEYSRTDNRMWRKNRENTTEWACPGVDMNRNFDSHHCEFGQTFPCSDVYCGPRPFSGPSLQVIRDQMTKLSNVKMTWSFHSYAQHLLFPYGYTKDHPSNYDDQYRVAGLAIDALYATHNKDYEYCSVIDFAGTACGGSVDWYYDSCNVPYAYCFELRAGHGGGGGFIIDESEIIPNSEEVWAAIMVASKEVM